MSQMEVAIKGRWCYVRVNCRVPERAVLIDSILGQNSTSSLKNIIEDNNL